MTLDRGHVEMVHVKVLYMDWLAESKHAGMSVRKPSDWQMLMYIPEASREMCMLKTEEERWGDGEERDRR